MVETRQHFLKRNGMTTDAPAGDMIDLVFPAVGPTAPRGHGYSLYGAI
jgi:hypothetical protein